MIKTSAHPYFVRTLIDGQATSAVVSKQYPNVAMSLFDSTVSRYVREANDTEVTVQLVQQDEIQYETTIPATVPDEGETDVELPEGEELVLKAINEGLFVPMSRMGSDERDRFIWALGIHDARGILPGLAMTFDDKEKAETLATLMDLDHVFVSRWVAVAGPEYQANPLVSGWRLVAGFI